MKPENNLNIELARKPHAYIEFGASGHETEYVFKMQSNKFSEAQDLPYEWEDELKKLLGENWSIMNRGHRLEIVPPNSKRTDETNLKLITALKKIVNNTDCQFIEKE